MESDYTFPLLCVKQWHADVEHFPLLCVKQWHADISHFPLLCVTQCNADASTYTIDLDTGHESCMVFLDDSRAFHNVWNQGLIHKLKSLGVDTNLLGWFKSYLNNRHNSNCSQWRTFNMDTLFRGSATRIHTGTFAIIGVYQ